MGDEITSLYVDGILDVQNLGANIGITYFNYIRTESGLWTKGPCLRLIRPSASFLNRKSAVLAWATAQPAPTIATAHLVQ